MAEIRLDARLARSGALVAGVADRRLVLVRMLHDDAAAEPWVAARAAGLPVPDVEVVRCARRPALVVPPPTGEPLTPAVAGIAGGQAAALGEALARHGIAAGRLRPWELEVRDGLLAVAVPSAGGDAGDPAVEAAALAATVAAACAAAPAAVRRRPGPMSLGTVAATLLTVLVLVLAAWPGASPPAPRAPVAQAAPRTPPASVWLEPAPAVRPVPPVARPKPKVRVQRPRRHHRRPVHRRPPPVRAVRKPHVPRPPTPSRHRVRHPAGIQPAGGHAQPVPVL